MHEPPLPFDPKEYDAHKTATALLMSHFLNNYLSLLYREYDGDLAMVIVMGEVAHHNVSRFLNTTGDCIEVCERAEDFQCIKENFLPTNAFSISQATGIPRETVRRKIVQLQKKGWLDKNDKGDIHITEEAVKYFTTERNKKLLAELIKTSKCIDELLEPD